MASGLPIVFQEKQTKTQTMKTLTTILLTILSISTAFSNDEIKSSELNEKYYEINKWGYAQYTYWMVKDKKDSKFGPKPISDRTLYLETAKAGIIDQSMTWKEFQTMSFDEVRTMLVEVQQPTINAMENGIPAIMETALQSNSKTIQ